MTKRTKRRIKEVWEGPTASVVNSIDGNVVLKVAGEKLAVEVHCNEWDLRELAKAIRSAFKEIRESRARANSYNFASLEQD